MNEKALGGFDPGRGGAGQPGDRRGANLITYLGSQSSAAIPGIPHQLSPANLTPLYRMGFATAQAKD